MSVARGRRPVAPESAAEAAEKQRLQAKGEGVRPAAPDLRVVETRVYRGLECIMARISDRLIGVSQATVADLVRLGVAARDKFTVVPLGLDLAPLAALDDVAGLRSRLRAEMRLDDDDVLLA